MHLYIWNFTTLSENYSVQNIHPFSIYPLAKVFVEDIGIILPVLMKFVDWNRKETNLFGYILLTLYIHPRW